VSLLETLARSRVAPAAVAFAIFAAVMAPRVTTTPKHPDEDQWVWAAGYYTTLALHGDFRPRGPDRWSDPRWDPRSYWGVTQGTPWLQGLALQITPGTSAPARPYSFTDPAFQGPDTAVDLHTLRVLRLFAVLWGAIGAALIAVRFRWVGTAAIAILTVLPGNVESFTRVWAEGPLLLGLGLCAVAWGWRWFPVVLGAVTTTKLTMLGLWPLVFWRRSHGRRIWVACLLLLGSWMLFMPPSWFGGGPFHLVTMIDHRVGQFRGQAESYGEGGIFLPARYLWPFELALLLGIGWAVQRLLSKRGTDLAARNAVRPGGGA